MDRTNRHGPALLLIAQLYRVEKQARQLTPKSGCDCGKSMPGRFWTSCISTYWRFRLKCCPRAFERKYREMHRLGRESDGSVTLYIGAENWPFPVRLVQTNGV